MGRSKGYERETLVTKAIEVFHRLGFKGASTQILVEALGVNRNSVYSEFGSKEGLFSAALEQYEKLAVSQIFGPLESSGANLDDIESLFSAFIENADAARGLGCLLCNTAAELGGAEPNLQPRIALYFDRLNNAFSNALTESVRVGQVPQDTDISTESRFLVAACLGIFITVRSGIPTPAAHAAAKGALRHLELLRHRSLVLRSQI